MISAINRIFLDSTLPHMRKRPVKTVAGPVLYFGDLAGSPFRDHQSAVFGQCELYVTIGDWISIVGLTIVIWQIWRAGRLTQATKKAVEDATRRVGVYNVLLLVPELSRLEREIEDAARNNEESALRRLLKEWREIGTDLRGALSNENVGDPEIDQIIKNSVALAMLAKQAMMTDGADLIQATKKVRVSIEQVCVDARMLAARIKTMATPLGILEPTNGLSPEAIEAESSERIKQTERAIRG